MPPIRQKPLRVLHLAMPKTGSVSMTAAYRALGYTTYHGFDYVARPSDQILWEAAIDAKFYNHGIPFSKSDFDAFLGTSNVLSDFPTLGFTEEFVEWYPDAKVVLVDREMEAWYHSFNTQVIKASHTWIVWVLMNFLEKYFMRAKTATAMLKFEYAFFRCDSQEGFERNARETYRRHYELVRRLVPKERLLEYKLGSGWGPLCEFLGEDVPEVPFPFLNESKEFAIWMRKTQMRTLRVGIEKVWRALGVPVVVLGVAYVVWKSGLFGRLP